MSYEHLAGRIVEIQRSMVGRPAITIAQSTEGLVVTDDGNVKSVEDDPCAVLDELVDGYTEMLGDPAATRFRTAAAEFRGELELPDSLVDPDERGREATGDAAGSADATSSEDGESADATSKDGDGATAIEISSPREAETSDDADEGDDTIDGSIMVKYTIQDDRSAGQVSGADLDSVYLLTEDEHDWKAPVTVSDAITSAVTSASDVDRDELGDIEEYVQSDRVLSTLYAESQAPVSFEVRDLKVTLYSNGTVRVQGQ